MMRLSIRSFVALSVIAFGGFLSLQACTTPPTAPPKERFFCATHPDCPQPAVCIRSLCYPLSSGSVTCTSDQDSEPICVPNPNESLVLPDGHTTPPEDDDIDSTQIADTKPDSSRRPSEKSPSGRENESEPPFEPNLERAFPDASEDTSGGLERKHIERIPEPSPEPQVLPDSPRDPNTLCTQGQTIPCYPTDTKGCALHSGRCLGRCKLGQQTCEKGTWGACTGAITPQTERCDDQDWDCDGFAGNNGGRVCN